MSEYEKWSQYKLGDISWIKNNQAHPHRSIFTNWVVNSNIESVVEVGPGEMIEYRAISAKKDIDYAIVEVAELFINNCRKSFPEVVIHESNIENLNIDNRYDVVYAASVIEHSKDVFAAIKNMMKLADRFHFVLFKWSYDGGLKSFHKTKKRKKPRRYKYWSTSFNIYQLIELIKKYGTIECCSVISSKSGKLVNFDDYAAGKKGKSRGDYLIISGKTNV